MRLFPIVSVLTAACVIAPTVQARVFNYCRPDGGGRFICEPEEVGTVTPPKRVPPPLTTQIVELIHKSIQNQIPTIPYTMTSDEMTDAERHGGTATNEERAAQPGSQFVVCEDQLDELGY